MKVFPPMYSEPNKTKIIALLPCWLWVFVLLPMSMPILGLGLWEQWERSVWLEIVYHIANGILLLWVIFSYLKEDWFMVTTDVRYYLKHIALTVGLIAGTELIFMETLSFLGFNTHYLLQYLPTVEMSVSHSPLFVIELEPIFGSIALSIFAPISICALFYCFGFAPICTRKPWCAYLCIAVITLIPPVIDILWRGDVVFVLSGYIVHLPIHLIACWSYQKTDNVWTPMASLMISNILASIILPILLFR